ncbi:MAG: SDR family oxidoreductase [Ardenticatenaceae bacterium]|nr:SDR family oxidoreductase [Ardenticatenaceae bacterium]
MSSPVILITGAASGIGRAFAASLHDQNYQLVLTDINETALNDAFNNGQSGAHLKSLDVTSSNSWKEAVTDTLSRFGRIDFLFNIAGVIMPGHVYETPLENIDLHFDVNVKGVLIGMRLVSEVMVSQGSGHIVNIASLAGIAPVPGISLYSASKFAVRGYSLATATELREKGVYVTVVCPGLVDTPMLDLQLNHDEAAITFSNGPALSSEHVAEQLNKVMQTRPLEVCIPNGTLPKMTNAFPRLNGWLKKIMEKRGRKAMAKLKQNGKTK